LLWEGRLSTQAPEIDGVCYINDFGVGSVPPRPGEMRRLRVTEAHDYDLVGELTGVPEPWLSRHSEKEITPFPILQSQTQRTVRTSAIPAR